MWYKKLGLIQQEKLKDGFFPSPSLKQIIYLPKAETKNKPLEGSMVDYFILTVNFSVEVKWCPTAHG